MQTPGDAMAEAMGVGRASVRWWRVLALATSASTLGLGGWLAWEIKTEPIIEPYVLIIDEETRVLDSIQARRYVPGAEAYTHVAQTWVFNIRTRSPNDAVTTQLREAAKKFTAKEAYPMISKLLTATDESLRGDGIEVDAQQIKVFPNSIEDMSGIVRVEWRERKYKRGGGTGAWVKWYATIKIDRLPPEDSAAMTANGFGLFVTTFVPNVLGTESGES